VHPLLVRQRLLRVVVADEEDLVEQSESSRFWIR
jgi:hypothetical protein